MSFIIVPNRARLCEIVVARLERRVSTGIHFINRASATHGALG